MLFQDAAAALAVAARAIPDIPFVERDIDRRFAELAASAARMMPAAVLDAVVQLIRTRQEIVIIVVRDCRRKCAARDNRYGLSGSASTVAIPADPVGSGAEIGRSRGDQLDARDRSTSSAWRLRARTCRSRPPCDAPSARAIHLVAEAPVLHFPGLLRGRSAGAASSSPCPPATLQYSTHCCASVHVPVPRLAQI